MPRLLVVFATKMENEIDACRCVASGRWCRGSVNHVFRSVAGGSGGTQGQRAHLFWLLVFCYEI